MACCCGFIHDNHVELLTVQPKPVAMDCVHVPAPVEPVIRITCEPLTAGREVNNAFSCAAVIVVYDTSICGGVA